jgi:carboxymethylenebutenolidase
MEAQATTTTEIQLESAFGPFTTFQAAPIQPPATALVLGMEGFGMTPFLQEFAVRLAAEGHLVLAPDLYSHDGERASLHEQDLRDAITVFSDSPDAEVALGLYGPERQEVITRAWAFIRRTVSLPSFAPDLVATVDHLRSEEGFAKERTGLVGFCRGGGLVGEVAAEGIEVGAAVIFYGTPPDLEKVERIQMPLQGHYARLDRHIKGAPEFEHAMRRAGRPFETHWYEGAGHGFFNHTSVRYHAESAQLAWSRLTGFLDRTLGRHDVASGSETS